MFLARRSAAPARQLLRRQPQRRFDSHSAHEHHHPAAPVSESFGPSFYVAISTFVAGFVLYRVSRSNEDSWISGLIKKYQPPETLWEERNAIHTAAVEKAAVDRHLFRSAGPNQTIPLKDPELFNNHAPYNIPAGEMADLSAVAAHYHKKNQKMEEERVARLKDGKVVSIYD